MVAEFTVILYLISPQNYLVTNITCCKKTLSPRRKPSNNNMPFKCIPQLLAVPQIDYCFGLSETMQSSVSY